MANNTTYSFGSGFLIAEIDGDIINFGTLQSATVSFESELAELTGNFQTPVAIARTNMTITGSASYAEINSEVYNRLFFGDESTSGSKVFIDEQHTVAETVQVDDANFIKDFGVMNAVTGVQYKKVSSALTPSSGQYKVDADGTYTFAAEDVGQSVVIKYTASTSAGRTTLLTNKLMGSQPIFSIILASEFEGKTFNMELYKCTSSSWSIDKSNTDFNIPSFEFQAFSNDAGLIGEIYSNSTK